MTGNQGPIGLTGAKGDIGLTGDQGPQGLLPNGTSVGNIAYWDGTEWVVSSSNIYNNGGNIGIGTTSPDPSAITEMNSTTKGFLPPRVTSTQRDEINNPANGLIVFNITTGCPNYYFSGSWFELCGSSVNISITALNCGTAINYGTLTENTAAIGVNSTISYTGGNSAAYPLQTVSSTGVLGLTATLAAGTLVNGDGTLTFNINGTPTSAGTASFALSIGGQTCNLTRTIVLPVGTLTGLTCGSTTNNGTLTSGTAASGVSSDIPYTGGNGGTHSGQTVNSTGVTGLTATLSASTFARGVGNLTYTITGTPASAGTATFALSIGGLTCSLTRTINLPEGTLSSLTCGSATNNGTLTSGTAASGVSSDIPYTGGNGGTHSGQTVTSTGVTGLTATLSASTFASGVGNLTYTITGTPTSSGTATFALSIGGQTCNLTRTVNSSFACGTSTVTFTYNGESVTYGTVSSSGKCWLDRNLGATQVATSSTDANSYGDLYQWGRGADGHQIRTSGVTFNVLSSTDAPDNSKFMPYPSAPPFDWRSPQNDNLWQGASGTNNPCPSGYRLPTEAELEAEHASWTGGNNVAGAFASPLKLPVSGFKMYMNGIIYGVGEGGFYWSSTVSSTNSKYLIFDSSNSGMFTNPRSSGYSVRCLKD